MKDKGKERVSIKTRQEEGITLVSLIITIILLILITLITLGVLNGDRNI